MPLSVTHLHALSNYQVIVCVLAEGVPYGVPKGFLSVWVDEVYLTAEHVKRGDRGQKVHNVVY